MQEYKWINLSASLVKIGNSYSVRIPMNVIKEIKAEDGSVIAIKIKKLKLEISPEILDKYYREAKNCIELKDFTAEKIILLSRLSFNEGKYILESMENKYLKNIEKEHKMLEALKKYRENIEKEFWKKVYDDYLLFKKIIDSKLQKGKK